MSEGEISWEDFKKRAKELIAKAREENGHVLFRGHASGEWTLDTTLDRSNHDDRVTSYYRLIFRVRPEIEAYTGLRWADDSSIDLPAIEAYCSQYETFSQHFGMRAPPHYAYMTYLRHHGFPSPLLDWSTSPFVAAFFAFRSSTPADRVAIFAFRERDKSGMKTSGSDLPAVRVCGPYVSAPKRHFAQQSQYTVCTMWSDDAPYFYEHNGVCRPFDPKKQFQQDIIFKFELASYDRAEVLRELNDYGLNAYSLFGSEEGLVESLSTREEVVRE